MLLIDDAIDIHRLLETRLRAEDLELVSILRGAEGLETAKRINPALILLDLNMPDMDGFEVLRLLKADPQTVDTPVIVISGSDQTADKVTGLDLGAIDYVCKPFNFPELRARVRAALRIHHLMQLLAQKAHIDGLTGLWNRQHFDERLAEEVAACERNDRSLTVVLCDLDNFKSLNDSYGHAAGDAVLQGFSRQLGQLIRRTDIACRYGGEEFAIILRDTDAASAMSLLERIRSELASMVWPRHPERSVTASFGLCDGPPGARNDPNAWVEAADKALYQAKEAGRNRIVVAGGNPGDAMPLAKAG